MIKLDREGVTWYNRSREDADGTRILREVRPDGSVLLYRYGVDGSLIGFTHNGASYYYGKNLFGDIVDIYNATGTKVAHYAYDAWGNHTVENRTTDAIGDLNPFRYRGYYYDDETKLYYLQTRYYDPNAGRFLSPDALAYLGADGELRGYNLYTYCGNNPVMNIDPSGHSILGVLGVLSLVLIAAGGLGGGIYVGVSGGTFQDVLWGILDGMLVGGLLAANIALLVGAISISGGLGLGVLLGQVMNGFSQFIAIEQADGFSWSKTPLVLSSALVGGALSFSTGLGGLAVVSGAGVGAAGTSFVLATSAVVGSYTLDYFSNSRVKGKEVTLDGILANAVYGMLAGTSTWLGAYSFASRSFIVRKFLEFIVKKLVNGAAEY